MIVLVVIRLAPVYVDHRIACFRVLGILMREILMGMGTSQAILMAVRCRLNPMMFYHVVIPAEHYVHGIPMRV